MMQTIISWLPMIGYIAIGLVALIVILNSFTIAGGNEFITLERKWFGKQMPDGRTVALSNEVGVQARILGPGFHLLIPFIYSVTKHKFLVIPPGNIGCVRAITGSPIPSGNYMAKAVDCDLFQDGEAFLKNGGEKGPQLRIIPEGEYMINPHLFEVSICKEIEIGEDEIGCVESVAGQPVSRQGGNFGKPVECDNYQNAEAFLQNGGEKGPQVAFLNPGVYRINTIIFSVSKQPIVEIPSRKLGLIEALDGQKIPGDRLFGKKIDGHKNFYDGWTFIENGGERGSQLEVLMPGKYRINRMLFKIVALVDWVTISADEVGIVTINEGRPLTDKSKIAADEIPNIHNNFQEPEKFLSAGGQKGLQIPVLLAGNYAINPWFATIEKKPMLNIDIGQCGVVTSFVGDDGDDLTDENVNAKIVQNGKKGIWAEPLQPGKHPINLKICKVDVVPTTQISLNWADSSTSAHALDANLKTITLRTSDAFNVNMDVNVIIHISMKNAPKVIANLGSMQNMITQVLEPAISSHFRNAAQHIKALDLYTQRAELQEKAKRHIIEVLKDHHIDSKDTMISDVVLPIELTKPVTDRQIAEQEKKTYITQMEAQEECRKFENAKAQAAMQPKVVESERNVEIAKNIAEGKIRESEGLKQSNILKATGEAESLKLKAIAEAEAKKVTAEAEATATKVTADAEAEAKSKIGQAEATVISSKGKATAEAYKLQVDAMGQDNFTVNQLVEKIANSNIKLIPENIIVGGGDGGNIVHSFMGLAMLEKLTGKKFTPEEAKLLNEKI